jgi:cytochrome d ubiquinol oxidase subunit I
MDALTLHRIQFAFTVTFHYLFPQLTIGLALFILVFKTCAIKAKTPIDQDRFNSAARFWAKIFAVNFTMGVVTGIPMEFQFGTNWARFSESVGGVIGQTLGLEGVFSFFLESTFLGLFLWGESRLSPRLHWLSAFMVFAGAWLSGFFITATDAWMQHPVGYEILSNGHIGLTSLTNVLLNPWLEWQYLHTMLGAVMTGSAVMSSVGAFYILNQKHLQQAKMFVCMGVIAGACASVLLLFPTGDQQGNSVAKFQPVTLAAMEGLFQTKQGAALVILGQPDLEGFKIDNALEIPDFLSFLSYRRWDAQVKGLDAFAKDEWPDNIALVYYSYHIMVGIGTIFILILLIASISLWRQKIYTNRAMLWVLLLMFPFPYIANTAGWMTAEMGRQPWLVYGLIRTRDGSSSLVTAGNTLFTLLGFMGMYTVLAMLFLLLIYRILVHGPSSDLIQKGRPHD